MKKIIMAEILKNNKIVHTQKVKEKQVVKSIINFSGPDAGT